MALAGIRQRKVEIGRLKVHIREAGEGATTVVLIHGNCSSGAFYEDLMLAIPAGVRVIAPDLRGYGETDPVPVDATRGTGDWADDLEALVNALGIDRFHLLGWSLGGGVVMRYVLDHPGRVQTLTLMAPVSPYGFGGTKDAAGTPCTPDFAGSGAGCVNPEFARRVAEGDRTADSPFSPLNVMNGFYWKAGFKGSAEQEERWLSSLLSTRCGLDFYPGDLQPSTSWPGVAPGTRGFANAMSAKYYNVSAFAGIQDGPPVLWIRGDSDAIVSDTSMLDLGNLGALGYVPGWPGAEAFPPQPMVAQTRAVLDAYQANGNRYKEVVLEGTGHSPHIEQPAAFQREFFAWIGR